MTWHATAWLWLAHLAVGGSLFLAAGCLAVRLCRHPVRRIRLIELTLAGSLLVPVLGLLPGLPHWSAGWLPAEPVTPLPVGEASLEQPATATPLEPFPTASAALVQATAPVEGSPPAAAPSTLSAESKSVEPGETTASTEVPSFTLLARG